jgi:transposase
MHRKRLDLIDEVRNDNPEASSRKVHEIAELLSEERFGEKVSYKTFERAEKKQKS